MGMKDKLKQMKDQAQKLGKEAVSTAGTVKDVLKTGVDTSKATVEKVLGSDGISKGLKVTAQGAKVVAKTARTLADTMEKASEKVGELNEKIRKK